MTDPTPTASDDLEAVAMPSNDEIRAAIQTTEYKYFGDYEMSPQQFAAVDVLVSVAQAALAAAPDGDMITPPERDPFKSFADLLERRIQRASCPGKWRVYYNEDGNAVLEVFRSATTDDESQQSPPPPVS